MRTRSLHRTVRVPVRSCQGCQGCLQLPLPVGGAVWQQSRDKSLPDSKKSLEHSDDSVISHVLESILTLSGSSSQKLLV